MDCDKSSLKVRKTKKGIFDLKHLLKFNTTTNFSDFFNENIMYSKWKIVDLSIRERIENVSRKNKYFSNLYKLADEKNLSYNKSEIISWLDSLSIMSRVISRLSAKNIELTFIKELHIPYSNRRTDYTILKGDKVLILEFSFKKYKADKDDFEEFQYINKLTQAMCYKELLSNIFPADIKIGTYTFLIEPEYDDEYDQKQEMENKNETNITSLVGFINDFFYSPPAIDALSILEKQDLKNVKREWNKSIEHISKLESENKYLKDIIQRQIEMIYGKRANFWLNKKKG